LRERYDELQGRGVEVLALAPASREETAAFAGAQAIPFPLLADPALDVFSSYDVQSRFFSLGQRPALYAIDTARVVRYAFLGSQQWELGEIDQALSTITAAT
jgi:peroxiredoxin